MFLRKFIILNTQSSKDVKGHAKLEIRASKARLSLSIEGAQENKDAIYKLYIVSNESNNFKQVELGRVDIDKKGRGKLELGFNANSVAQSNLNIDNFNILLLKREDHLTKQSEIILGGYIHKDDDTMSELKSKHKNKVEMTSNAKPRYEESAGKTENIEKINIKKEKDIKEIVDTAKKSKLSETPELKEQKVNQERNYSDTRKEDSPKQNSSTNTNKHYNDQIASYTLDILKIFKRVNPFKIEFEDYKWWQIDCEEVSSHRGFLPYYSYILNSNNQNKANKHDHYLFGIIEKEEKITHYVYAIPGKYQRKDHPHGGKTGFVTWLEDKTGSGYWLSYIDARTGNVVRPR